MYSYDGNIAFSADFTKHNNQKKNGCKSWYYDNMIVFIFISLEKEGPVHCSTFYNHTGQSVKDLNTA